MKKFLTAFTAMLTLTVSATAMSYSEARDRALFLTDKMAYELNLTEAQYEAAYEVNLDYLMSINTYDDLYGTYWTNRNLDLSYILMDWQYRAFCAASYFYRPLYWDAGVWHFSIYSRYPHRSYFYFGRPSFYNTYRGGHGWRFNGGRSWYRGRDFGHGYIARGNGMKDRFERGDFRRESGRYLNRGSFNRQGRNDGSRFDRNGNRNNRNNGYRFERDDNRNDRNNDRGNSSFNRRNSTGGQQRFTQGGGRNGASDGQSVNRSTPRRSFGNSNGGERVNRESSTRTTVQPSRMMRGSQRQLNSRGSSQRSLPSRPNNTFTPRSNSGSSASFRSAPSRSNSHSGGMTRSSSGSNKGNGGGHFGGRH